MERRALVKVLISLIFSLAPLPTRGEHRHICSVSGYRRQPTLAPRIVVDLLSLLHLKGRKANELRLKRCTGPKP